MLARHDGRIVLVAGAIPGERVRARVERTSRAVLWAETIEVLTASPDRRAPPCDPTCGGALYAHIRYERQRQLKGEVVADAFRRIGKIDLGRPPEVASSPEHGYRLRARLHVRGGRAGFFREGTHALCDAAATGQLHAATMPAVTSLCSALEARLSDGDSITVAENVAATERVLHLLPGERGRLDDLRPELSGLSDVTGVTVAGPSGPVVLAGSATVSDSATDLFGADPPVDPSCTWRRGAASFFQANRFLLGTLVRRALQAGEGDFCVDLYSGVGLFAVALAARGSRVVAVESDPQGVADLSANAVPWGERLRVVNATVETFARSPGDLRPDVVILDPPRTGASREALERVVRWRARRLVYVSCDAPTLARDAGRLAAAGYELRSVEAFDLFPNTPHVETLAVFDR